MPVLEQLVKKYGNIQSSDISLSQLEGLRLSLQKVEENEITSAEKARQFLSLLRAFREGLARIERLNGDKFLDLIHSLLAVGEDGLYSNKIRFLFELIQNVDDCDYVNNSDRKLDVFFDIDRDRIILRYNETGFTPYNVFSITGIAEAAKNISDGKVEIGEKGIGFKSVFGVAEKVQIQSNWFAFELRNEQFTVPITIPNVSKYNGTEMVLFLQDGMAAEIFAELKKMYFKRDALFVKNPLLFLNKLTSLKFHNDKHDSLEFRVDRSENNKKAFNKDSDVSVSVRLKDVQEHTEIERTVKCTRYLYNVVFSQAACRARYGSGTKVGQKGGKPMSLQLLFPNPEDLAKVTNGALYSFLPTQLRLTVPAVIHVPFKLGASREFVDPQNPSTWFNEACRFLLELLNYAYSDFSQYANEHIVSYIPPLNTSLFAENNGKEKCLSSQTIFLGKQLSKLPIFHTARGNYVGIDKVFCFSEAEKIYDPNRASELLQLSKELFVPFNYKSAERIGMQVERNIYQRLFHDAIHYHARTDANLSYLVKAGYRPTDEDLPKGKFAFPLNQISSLMEHKRIAQCLMSFGRKHITTGQLPPFSAGSASFLGLSSILYHDFQVSEAPKLVEQYLRSCELRCALVDMDEDFYLPCKNMLVLSSRNPVTSFAAFCFSIDNKDTFSVRMRHREISEKLNELTKGTVGTPADYLRELRNFRKLVKETLGAKQYKNYIDLIVKSGVDHTRFIQELLQNADDCIYESGVVPSFDLQLENGRIITEYNERGFSRANIRAITAIGESTKNQLLSDKPGTIGEKGVGFKTVFSTVASVKIHSRGYHFELLADSPTIPNLLEDAQEHINGTRMEFLLRSGCTLPALKETDILSLCLCLNNLKRINFNSTVVIIEDTDESRIITINRKQFTFARFVHPFTVSQAALKERQNGLRKISPQQKICLYVPQKNAGKEYPLYCGLPTKHMTKVPLVIDAPFALTTSREQIELGSQQWNDAVRMAMYQAILKLIHSIKGEERMQVLRFAKFRRTLQGKETKYLNELFDFQYLNNYPYLELLKAAYILPTFDRTYFAAAKENSALRYPEAVNYLFTMKEFGGVSAQRVLDVPKDDSLNAALDALGCRNAPYSSFMPVIQAYAGKYIKQDEFRSMLYSCLLGANNEYRSSIRDLPIIPVFNETGTGTDFIPWEEDSVFVKKQCDRSNKSYFVLNEAFLSKADCERIMGVNINEMNFFWEKNRYNEELRQVIRGNNPKTVYSFLLEEFAKGSFTKYDSAEILKGMKDMIPLRNQLGIITDSKLFVCRKPEGYFQTELILGLCVHEECKKLAEYLCYEPLSGVHYDDIIYHEELTSDDIDELYEYSGYFVNREEIVRCFYRDGQISYALLKDAGLEHIAMRIVEDDEKHDFPGEYVGNLYQLKKHMQTLLQNPIRIKKVIVERTVDRCEDQYGKTFSPDDRDMRMKIIGRYTPEGVHDRCFCQLCRAEKPHALIEVNNIIPNPKFYFAQTRIALCLDCSKRFEAIRDGTKQKTSNSSVTPFINAIQETRIGYSDTVEVQLTTQESVCFTAKHLAEIQEILSNYSQLEIK